MSKRLLWAAMLLASLAMLLLVGGWLLMKLALVWPAQLIFTLAGKLMLLAFGLLMLMLTISLLLSVGRGLRRYFSAEARALRALLSLRMSKISAKQAWAARVAQLRYRASFKRRDLLRADNYRQLRSLFRAIDAELRAAQARLSPGDYRQLRLSLRRGRRQADAAAMLAIRERLL